MFDRISHLLGHSALYMAANFLQRGLSFLLIPMYATYFTTAEFGAMDMLYQMAIALSLFTSFGLPQGLVRGFYLVENNSQEKITNIRLPEIEQKKLLGALLTFLLLITIFITLLLQIFAPRISIQLFNGEGNTHWVRLTIWLYIALVLQGLPLQLFKTEQRSKAFTLWSLVTFGIIAFGNLFLIIKLKLGLNGMILGNLIGVGGTAIIMFIQILPKIKWNWEWSRLAPLFAFGLPMLPNLLSRKVLEVGNRYMLPHWHGLTEVGLFSMAARVSSIIDILLLVPFLYAWQPFFYSMATNPNAKQIFAKVTHYFLLLAICIFLGMQIFQFQFLHFMGRGKFDSAGPVIIFLVLASLFNGLQICVSAGIHLSKNLVPEMGLMIASAILNIIFNFLFIPRFGAMGAAMSTAIAFLFFLIGSYLLAQRVYPVPYLWKRSGLVLMVGTLSFFSMQYWKGPLIQIGIFIGFVAVGPVYDLWRHGELQLAQKLILNKFKKIEPKIIPAPVSYELEL